MIIKLQISKVRTKSNFSQNISNYYGEMIIRRQKGIFQFEEDPFSINVQGVGKIYHEVLIIMKLLQTKSQVKSMNNNYYYDLFYTVIKLEMKKKF